MEDTDFGGVMYHANYFKFCERARTDCLAAIGYHQSDFAMRQSFFVVRDIKAVYYVPAVLGMQVDVRTDVEIVTKCYVVFNQTMFCEDKLLFVAKVKVIYVKKILEGFRVSKMELDILRKFESFSSLYNG